MNCVIQGMNGNVKLLIVFKFCAIITLYNNVERVSFVIKIGICDDSSAFLQQLKFMIDHWDNCPQNVSTELFEDGEGLLFAHARTPFDIILLDVVMPTLNGIEVVRKIRLNDKNVKIVFLTSSSDFAVESYTVKANNYLLKPIEPTKLFDCLDELISEIQSVSRCLIIKGTDAVHKIPFSSIEYAESQSKHIIFYTTDNRAIKSSEPLYIYESTLAPQDGFYKCHRSYIVNIHHIDSFSPTEVIMRSGCRIPISRSHRKDFEDIYFHVIFEKARDDL